MKSIFCALVAFSLIFAAVTPLPAASSADEQAFLATYRKALEAKDAQTLHGFLYIQGADPMVIDFYKSMQSEGVGEKISAIELVDLTPEQIQDAAKPKDGPGGKMALPLKPIKKLVITSETKNENGSSKSTSSCFIAEVDGKLVIPVPTPVK